MQDTSHSSSTAVLQLYSWELAWSDRPMEPRREAVLDPPWMSCPELSRPVVLVLGCSSFKSMRSSCRS